MEIEGIPHPLQGRARPATTTGGGIPALRGELPGGARFSVVSAWRQGDLLNEIELEGSMRAGC
jgi:hypothetical protein